jgi:uncharacterized Ntn-hydrolase superfamily protein
MAETFVVAGGELSDRLMEALLAGDTVGGDSRGKQSAALLVVKPGGGYGGDNDRYLDLRVDDHPEPVRELKRVLQIHHLYYSPVHPEDRLSIDEALARELQSILVRQGYFHDEINGQWDESSRQALWKLVGKENLEERWNLDDQPEKIDPVTLDYLRSRFKTS